MPKRKAYRVLNPLVSVRKRSDPACREFVEWRQGEIMRDYPAHTDIDYLLARGAIVEVTDGEE